jgi:hypothetical protein
MMMRLAFCGASLPADQKVGFDQQSAFWARSRSSKILTPFAWLGSRMRPLFASTSM